MRPAAGIAKLLAHEVQKFLFHFGINRRRRVAIKINGLGKISVRLLAFCYSQFTKMKSETEWLRKLTALNPALNKRLGSGNERFAPHKPLLLLCVFELVEQDRLQGTQLSLTADLALRFQSFWRIVVSRWTTKPELRMPFHHLSTQEFWKPLTKELKLSNHRSLTEAVEIDSSFLAAMQDAGFRRRARAVLISHYFPPFEQIALRDLTGIGEKEVESAADKIKEEARAYARSTARDARFRIQVVSSYLFTCALTGYSLTTVSSSSIVDAAHIHERRDSKNDDPLNGLALSKNAHWMFDEGLWSMTDDLKIIVAEKAFTDWSPDGVSLRNYHGRSLFFQRGCTLRPDRKYIAWHREQKFQA
jgi:putative restriction endonuclease